MTKKFNPYNSKEVKRNLDATHSAWKVLYEVYAIEFLNQNEIFDGSKLCEYIRRRGLWEPHHPNSWVSMVTVMAKYGYIVPAQPATVPGSARHSHNNNITLWRSIIYKGIKKEVANDQ